MLQKIPLGVSKITSARNLSSNYKEIIEDLQKDADSVLGITNKNEIKFIILSNQKYEQIMKILEKKEEGYIHEISKKGTKDYEKGEVVSIDDWLKLNGKY